MDVSRFDLANLMAVAEGENSGSVRLPPVTPSDPAAVWKKWTQRYAIDRDDCIRRELSEGELLVFRMRVDKQPCSLVTFVWSDGSFDGAVLVDGYVNSLDEAFEVWLGGEDLCNIAPHPILALLSDEYRDTDA
jgi:hypothetical protein